MAEAKKIDPVKTAKMVAADSETIDDESTNFKTWSSSYDSYNTWGRVMNLGLFILGARNTGARPTLGNATLMNKPERLNIMYENLTEAPPAKTAQEAMEQMSSMLNKVEDAFSGIRKNPSPGLT